MTLEKLSFELTEGETSIRTLKMSDVDSHYLEWMNDPLVNQFLESRFAPQTLESIKEFTQREFESPSSILFGIFLGPASRHIGNIKVGPVNFWHGTAEVGFLIGAKECWGRGYASKAINLAANFAFDSQALRKLTAGVYSSNIGSVRALKKSGFSVEAVLKRQVLDAAGYPQDVVKLARFASWTDGGDSSHPETIGRNI